MSEHTKTSERLAQMLTDCYDIGHGPYMDDSFESASISEVAKAINETVALDDLVSACEELSTAVEVWGRRVGDRQTPHHDEAKVAMAQLAVRDALAKAKTVK